MGSLIFFIHFGPLREDLIGSVSCSCLYEDLLKKENNGEMGGGQVEESKNS